MKQLSMNSRKTIYLQLTLTFFLLLISTTTKGIENDLLSLSTTIDPLTRYIHITYTVPADAPNEIIVLCSWSPIGKNEWRPAKVTPFISEMALRLVRDEEWQEWTFQGRIKELCAGGLKRTVVFNPYPEAQIDGKVSIDFRIEIQSPDGKILNTQQGQIQADNSDIVYIEDWSQALQKDLVTTDEPKENDRKWFLKTDSDPTTATFGNILIAKKWRDDISIPQLTYPLNLHGWYAVFVCTPKDYSIRLRFTGDERSDVLNSPKPFQETLWRWCPLDRQHLIIKQNHYYTGYTESRMDYIKLVPLSSEQVQILENQFGTPDKIIAGYFEPYSWAFFEDIQETLQHREPISAYKEARINIVDIQVGRFGMKVVYESRLTDQLLYNTIGDPIGGVIPHTNNVGKMQQMTNTLQTELQYAHELGLTAHANFGATNCYPGTPLQSDITKQHPDWMTGGLLRYDIPEVRQYILSLLKETLEIGADGISIDFCRYPGGIDKPETCNQFLRELKSLRNEFAQKRNKSIPLLLRFPAKGVSHWEQFDYNTWIHEGLVDYLCPSNIQGRHMHFDITPYIEAVRGSTCKLLPVIDGLSWGPEMPALFLWRVHQLYQAGTDGIYVYQSDARICTNNRPEDRRCMRLISSSEAVHNWWQQYNQQNQQFSRRIWLQPSEDANLEYHNWERCRIWIEGIQPIEVQLQLDAQLINTYTQPPYILGGEDYTYDNLITPGTHTLTIHAKTQDTTLSQTFTITGTK
ncbi:MAG TPA: hypothetical protein PLJ10_11465 [Candidatus Hydrogenedens sp.]|nr:hypothetical protein [Candidatus Hydrogenedens sp.]